MNICVHNFIRSRKIPTTAACMCPFDIHMAVGWLQIVYLNHISLLCSVTESKFAIYATSCEDSEAVLSPLLEVGPDRAWSS